MSNTNLLRHWLIQARAGTGKSTFAASMNPKFAVIDYDHRWAYHDTENSTIIAGRDNIIEVTDKIKQLNRNGIGTVVIDSLTVLTESLVASAQVKKSLGLSKSTDLDWAMKAASLRLLRGAVLSIGCDTLWIAHIEERKKSGVAYEHSTISQAEREALQRVLNAELTIVTDEKGRRGIRIEWSRYNGDSITGQKIIVWDNLGMWKGVADKVQQAMMLNIKKDYGYTNVEYSPEWLIKFLLSKGKDFSSTEDIAKKLHVDKFPEWYDRNSWLPIIEKGLA